MALFIFCSNGSSFSTRFYILALIALVLICFSSYCSSSSVVEINPSFDDLDEFNIDDEVNDLLSLPHYIQVPEQTIFPSKNRLIYLLRKPEYRHEEQNKRQLMQSFHAMRG